MKTSNSVKTKMCQLSGDDVKEVLFMGNLIWKKLKNGAPYDQYKVILMSYKSVTWSDGYTNQF